jgi:hypothetical protein
LGFNAGQRAMFHHVRRATQQLAAQSPHCVSNDTKTASVRTPNGASTEPMSQA